MGSLAKGSLRKVCGNSAEILRKVHGQYVLLRQERVRKFCGKFAEISQKFAENFLQWPLPERPHKCSADFAPEPGSWGQQIQEYAPRRYEGSASPGAHSELRISSIRNGETRKPGQLAHASRACQPGALQNAVKNPSKIGSPYLYIWGVNFRPLNLGGVPGKTL